VIEQSILTTSEIRRWVGGCANVGNTQHI